MGLYLWWVFFDLLDGRGVYGVIVELMLIWFVEFNVIMRVDLLLSG